MRACSAKATVCCSLGAPNDVDELRTAYRRIGQCAYDLDVEAFGDEAAAQMSTSSMSAPRIGNASGLTASTIVPDDPPTATAVNERFGFALACFVRVDAEGTDDGCIGRVIGECEIPRCGRRDFDAAPRLNRIRHTFDDNCCRRCAAAIDDRKIRFGVRLSLRTA